MFCSGAVYSCCGTQSEGSKVNVLETNGKVRACCKAAIILLNLVARHCEGEEDTYHLYHQKGLWKLRSELSEFNKLLKAGRK